MSKMAEKTKNTQSEIIEMESEQEPSEYSQSDMDRYLGILE